MRVPVPAQKRAVTWGSSAMVGASLYHIFASALTASPAREREETRGKIDGLMAEIVAPPVAIPPEHMKTAVVVTRQKSALMVALTRREAVLAQTVARKESWSLLIGLVAFVGCFALCSVYWVGRGAKELGQA